jgi:hypothetical protein
MLVSSISLSYVFFGVGAIALIFFLYFKVLVVKSSPNSSSRESILGDMKDPDGWRNSNNKMGYLFLFWAILSIGVFIYLKFFYEATLISIIIPFIYVGLVAVSASFFGSRRKNTAH